MNPERWRRIELLYNQALEIEESRRSAFLREACAGDDDLRHDIAGLLAQDSKASFLEQPAISEIASEFAVTAPPSWIGRPIGNYKFVSLVGVGGMGEVYRAQDNKLKREVAIKVLTEDFSSDPERVSRFRREAQLLASLNHPNIAVIYNLEEKDGSLFLILEFIEGETLADRIKRGPIPVEAALRIALQIAEALEAAHEKNIIHRDLKPANIKITADGKVKVLDFGLAKAIWQTEGNPGPSQLPTGTGVESLAGNIVGTPGYMSPEQARGTGVDQRTDIWAFGCLLYELLTGTRAFQGATLAETISVVLDREPDWKVLPARTPFAIRDLLRQCLQNDAGRRLHRIADARRIIEKPYRGWKRRRLVEGAAVALVLLAGTALWLRYSARPLDRSEWVQLTKLPDSVAQPALSPDGRMLAFVRGDSTFFGAGQIYLKILPDAEPVALTHDTLAKMSPAFSPDGARIAYTTVNPRFEWDTWAVPVSGGEPQLLLKNASGLMWTGLRQVLFSEIKMGVHMAVVTAEESRIGQRDVYVPQDEPGMAHRSYLSPDKKWVLLVEMDNDHLWLPCRVVPADGNSRGRSVGPPGGGCTVGAWSPDGKWMYFTSNAVGANHIWRQRFPDGPPEQVTSGPTEEEGIAMAPDGRSFVTAVAFQNTSVWVHDSHGDRQVSPEGNAASLRFTPNGKQLLYRTAKEAQSEFEFYRDLGEVRVIDLESGRSEPLVPGFQARDYDISADGLLSVLESPDDEGKPRLWIVPLDHSAAPRQIPNVEGGSPRFGSGGEIIFFHNESHAGFVYRVRPDGTGLKKAFEQPVLMMGDVSRDGKWIEAWAPLSANAPGVAWQAFPLGGGSPIPTGNTIHLKISLDGRSTFITSFSAGTYVIPLPPGEVLQKIPVGGFQSEDDIAHLPGAQKIDQTGVAAGPSADIYAFYRGTNPRSLYRIPIR